MSKIHFKGSSCVRPGAFTQTKHALKQTDDPDRVTCAFCLAHLAMEAEGLHDDHWIQTDDLWLHDAVRLSDKFGYDNNDMVVFKFGKYKGLICLNYPDYLRFISKTTTFDGSDRGIADVLLKKYFASGVAS